MTSKMQPARGLGTVTEKTGGRGSVVLVVKKKLADIFTRFKGKAQFIRRASAVPNLINIGFNRSTAQARLQFRRRARVELNSVFAQ